MKTILKKVGLGSVMLFAATAAFATDPTIDITGPVTALTTNGNAAISGVGNALLGLAAIAVAYKWAKAMFFA